MREIFFSGLLLVTTKIEYLKYNYINKMSIYRNYYKIIPDVLVDVYL